MPCHKPALHDVAVMLKQRISAVSDGHLFVFFLGGTIGARIMTHSETAVDDKYNSLVCIDVRDCRASRSEDG